jgi:hypothetical protein
MSQFLRALDFPEPRCYGFSTLSAYRVTGLSIDADLPLPDLEPASGGPDALLRRASIVSPRPEGGPGADVEGSPGDLRIRWPGRLSLRAREGRELLYDPDPGLDPAALVVYLLGPGLATLLHQRGRMVFHGTGIAEAGAGLLLLGESGAGKSTLAAAAVAEGFRLVADDVSPVNETSELLPGPGRLKVGEDAAAALGRDPADLAPLGEGFPKRVLRVPAARSPVPLAAVAVLQAGPRAASEALEGEQAFLALLGHSYCRRLLPDTGDRLHFERCAALAASVPVRRLVVPRDLGRLGEAVDRLRRLLRALVRP